MSNKWIPLVREEFLWEMPKIYPASDVTCTIYSMPEMAEFQRNVRPKTQYHVEAALWMRDTVVLGGTFVLPTQFPESSLDVYECYLDWAMENRQIALRTLTSEPGAALSNGQVSILSCHGSASTENSGELTPKQQQAGGLFEAINPAKDTDYLQALDTSILDIKLSNAITSISKYSKVFSSDGSVRPITSPRLCINDGECLEERRSTGDAVARSHTPDSSNSIFDKIFANGQVVVSALKPSPGVDVAERDSARNCFYQSANFQRACDEKFFQDLVQEDIADFRVAVCAQVRQKRAHRKPQPYKVSKIKISRNGFTCISSKDSLYVQISIRQYDNWSKIQHRTELEGVLPKSFVRKAPTLSLSGLTSTDDMALLRTVKNTLEKADCEAAPYSDMLHSPSKNTASGVHQNVFHDSDVDVTQDICLGTQPALVSCPRFADLVRALPAFKVDTDGISRNCKALDMPCLQPSSASHHSSLYLDLATCTSRKSYHHDVPSPDGAVDENTATSIEIAIDEASGECYLRPAAANQTVANHGNIATLPPTTEVSNPEACAAPLCLEGMELDKIFEQGATDLDDGGEEMGNAGSTQGEPTVWSIPPSVTPKTPKISYSILQAEGQVYVTDNSLGSCNGDQDADTSLHTSPMPASFMPKEVTPFPTEIIRTFNLEIHRIRSEGIEGRLCVPGQDEDIVNDMAARTVADRQCDAPDNIVELAVRYNHNFMRLWAESWWIFEKDDAHVSEGAGAITGWEVRQQILRLPENERRPNLEESTTRLDLLVGTLGGIVEPHLKWLTKTDDDCHNNSRYLGASSPESECHHLNFLGRWCHEKSNTSAVISAFAAVTAMRKQSVNESVCHKAVVLSQAHKRIDPFEFDGNIFEIDNECKGTALRAFATGRTTVAYEPCGSWQGDAYDEDDDLPVVATATCVDINTCAPNGQKNFYYGLQQPYVMPRYNLDSIPNDDDSHLRLPDPKAKGLMRHGPSKLRQVQSVQYEDDAMPEIAVTKPKEAADIDVQEETTSSATVNEAAMTKSQEVLGNSPLIVTPTLSTSSESEISEADNTYVETPSMDAVSGPSFNDDDILGVGSAFDDPNLEVNLAAWDHSVDSRSVETGSSDAQRQGTEAELAFIDEMRAKVLNGEAFMEDFAIAVIELFGEPLAPGSSDLDSGEVACTTVCTSQGRSESPYINVLSSDKEILAQEVKNRLTRSSDLNERAVETEMAISSSESVGDSILEMPLQVSLKPCQVLSNIQGRQPDAQSIQFIAWKSFHLSRKNKPSKLLQTFHLASPAIAGDLDKTEAVDNTGAQESGDGDQPAETATAGNRVIKDDIFSRGSSAEVSPTSLGEFSPTTTPSSIAGEEEEMGEAEKADGTSDVTSPSPATVALVGKHRETRENLGNGEVYETLAFPAAEARLVEEETRATRTSIAVLPDAEVTCEDAPQPCTSLTVHPVAAGLLSLIAAGDALEAEMAVDLLPDVAFAAGDVLEAEDSSGIGYNVIPESVCRSDSNYGFIWDASIVVGHAASALGGWVKKSFFT